MNKIYKLVYSKTLNSLVAVSELAKSAQAGSSSNVDLDLDKSTNLNLNKLALSFVVSSLFTALPLSVSATQRVENQVQPAVTATATADSNVKLDNNLNFVSDSGFSATNAGVVADGNGPAVKYINNVPVVDIVNANAAGVSDNRFSKFSTDTGVVFNNKAGSVEVTSQLLGKIQGNAKLTKEAEVILAQITGNDKSVIKGTMEVLGKKADLLVINPNGIDLNGVQLINTKEFTATTANLVDANNYKNLNVEKGEVNVNGSLTSDDVDLIRLIAAAVKVKAQISPHTKDGKKADIVVAGGKQSFDLNTNTGKATSQTKANTEVVISGDALGLMYGKNVNFIVSETGAGVDFGSTLIADEDLKITADGKIVVQNTFSKGNTTLESTGSDVVVNAAPTDKPASKVAALGKIDLKAKKEVNAVGTLHSNKAVSATANDVKVANVQADQVNLTATRSVQTADVSKIVANNVNIKTDSFALLDGKLVVNKDLVVDAKSDAIKQAEANKTPTTNRYNSQVRFNDEVTVLGKASVTAATVQFNSSKVEATRLAELKANNEALFKFNNLELEVNPGTIKTKAGVALNGGDLVANNVNVNVANESFELARTPLITAQNGKFTVHQTASLDLRNSNKVVTLNNPDEYNYLKESLNNLNGTFTELKTKGIVNTGDVKFDRAVRFTVDTFDNSGIIDAADSMSIVGNTISNTGVLSVKGQLVLNAKEKVQLDGATYVYNSLNVTAPKIEQRGRVSVGGNYEAVTDEYHQYTTYTGTPTVKAGELAGSANFHYHSLRKDKYWFVSSFGEVSTDDMKFQTTETTVLGNMKVEKLTKDEVKSVTADKDVPLFKVEDGRIAVGGDLTVDGSMEVTTTGFKVKAEEIFKYNQPFTFKFVPISLLNTYLTAENHVEYNNLYEFFESIDNRGDWVRGWAGYGVDTTQILNTFKQATIDPSLNKVISQVFGADWKGLSREQFVAKWNEFKANPDKFQTVIFAPNSEVLTLGNFTQQNGHLYVGSAEGSKISDKVSKGVANNKFHILIESSDNVDITKKISGVRSFESYADLFNKEILKNSDGTYKLAKEFGWTTYGDVAASITKSNVDKNNLIADSKALSVVVIEQYKDLAGGYLSVGKDAASLIANLAKGSKDYEAAKATYKLDDQGRATMVIDGKLVTMQDAKDLFELVDNHYDRIEWKLGSTGKWEPVVKLSKSTIAKTTNFDQVAATLSGVQSLRVTNNTGVDVVYGSLNSKHVSLDSTGSIKVVSTADQNAINSDTTNIHTTQDFTSIGNLRVGNLQLEAADVNLQSLAYFTENGHLNHTGNIAADNAEIKAENKVSLDAADIRATGDVKIEADQVELKSAYNEASSFVSDQISGEDSGRQITQSGYFVDSATVSAKNVEIKATDVTLESSKVVAEENATIETDTLTNTARADITDASLMENRISFTASAKAEFGSYKGEAAYQFIDSKDLDGNKNKNYYTSATDVASVATGAPVSAGLAFTVETTRSETQKSAHVNNQLSAENLVIKVTDHAELGNTNINTDGKASSALEDVSSTKKATIEAGSISQNNAKDTTDIVSEKHTTTVGVEISADSSAVALVSHATSAARAGDMGKKVDGTFALTALGDTLGLATADLAGGNGKLSVTDTRANTNTETVSDSTNHLGGSVTIKTSGDTQLKAISGNLVDLEISAKNLTIEGGVTETTSKIDNISHSASVDLNAGVGLTGASTSASYTQSFSMTKGTTESVTHDASKLNAENIKINVENDVTLKSTQLTAAEEASVKAENVSIISEQDTFKSKTTGGGASITAGASIGTAPMAFGSVGAFVERHNANSEKTNVVSGISGNVVKVEADTLSLQSAVLAAATEGVVNVDKIEVTNNVDKEVIDGGRAGGQIGTNKTGAAILNVNGGRDAHSEYEGVIKSTIGSTITVAEKAQVVDANGNETELNRDLNEVVDVVKNDKYQETTFSITATSNMIKDVKHAVEQIVGAASSGAHKIVDAVSDMVETAVEATTSNLEGKANLESVAAGGDNNGYGTKGGNASTAYSAVEYPAYRTHYVSAPDSLGYRDANTGYRSANNTYSSGSYRSVDYGPTYANPYANPYASSSTYGTTYSSGGSYNSSTGSWSNLGNNYDVGSSSLSLSSVAASLASSSFDDATPGYNSSRLQFSSSDNAANNLNRAYATDSTIELDKDNNIRDVRFTDVLAEGRGDSSNAVVGGTYNLVGETLSSVDDSSVASMLDYSGLAGSLDTTTPVVEEPATPVVTNPVENIPAVDTNTGSVSVSEPSTTVTTPSTPSTNSGASSIDVSKELSGVPGVNSGTSYGGSNSGFGGNLDSSTSGIGSVGGSSTAGTGNGGFSSGGSSSSSGVISSGSGFGSGTGSSSTTGGLSGTSSSGSTSTGSTGSNTGIASSTSNTGTGTNNGSAGSSFPANNGATGGYDLDFGDSSSVADSSSSSITVSSGSSSVSGAGSSSGSISGGNQGVNSSVTSGSSSSTATSVDSSENSVTINTSNGSTSSTSTTTSSNNGGLSGVLAGGEETSSSSSESTGSVAIGGSSSSSSTGATSSSSEGGEITTSSSSATSNSGSGSASVTVGSSSSSSASEETTVTNTTTGTTPNEYTINNTPADGFASVGEKIDVGSKSTVTKYTVGNLACYVMSTHGNQNTNKIENSDEFKKALKNASKPRQTIFSTYSNGIESLIGDGGVICMPQGSTEINTDYNIVKSTKDIPIIKSAAESQENTSEQAEHKPLEAIVVNEKQQIQVVRVVSNKSVQTKKVVREQARVNVAEVAKIKSTLQGQGIDAKQIMILGVKSGNNNSIIEKVSKGKK